MLHLANFSFDLKMNIDRRPEILQAVSRCLGNPRQAAGNGSPADSGHFFLAKDYLNMYDRIPHERLLFSKI
jgi:hypothetical protein